MKIINKILASYYVNTYLYAIIKKQRKMKTLVKSTDVQTVLNRMLDNEDASYVWDELVGCDMSKDTPETIEEEFHAGLNYIYDVLSSNEYNGKTLLQKVIEKDKDNVHSSLLEYEGIAHIIVKY